MRFEQIAHSIPEWVHKPLPLDHWDMKFLYDIVYESRAEYYVELGVASGVSSSVILAAMAQCRENDLVSSNSLHSFDIMEYCYFDSTIPIGAAIKEMIPAELTHLNLHTSMTARDVKQYFEPGTIECCFIDANHAHPWPALDTLTMLPLMKKDGVICLHDINLPIAYEDFPEYGAKYVFDDLNCQKSQSANEPPDDDYISNCGALHLNNDTDEIAKQLVEIIANHKWESEVEKEYLDSLGLA